MIILYCRKAPDWKNYTIEDVIRENPLLINTKGAEYTQKLIEQIHLWNSTFSINFFQFRQEVVAIAKSNWAKQTVSYCLDLQSYDDNDLIVPTDDDDWFRDDLSEYLSNLSSYDFIYWNTVRCCTCSDTVSVYSWFDKSYIMPPNGYAIRVSALKKMSEQEQWVILQRHGFAMGVINKYPLMVIGLLNECLSCYNVHIGTTSNLMDWDNTRGLYFKIPKDLTNYNVPKKIEWISKWFNDIKSLTLSLNKKRLFL